METIKEKIKSNKKIILLIICVLFFAFVIQKTLSKYIIQIEDITVQESPAFYFESEFASEANAKQYVINEWDGESTREIDVDVKNYLNSLLITELADDKKITYKINASIIDENTNDGDDSDLLTLQLKDADTNLIIANEELLEMDANTMSQKKYTLNIIPSGAIENGKTFKIRVTITSTSPYVKELVGEINITANTIESYDVNLIESDNREYMILNVRVNKTDKDIIIKYNNEKTIVDKSSGLIKNLKITKGTATDYFTIPKENLKKGELYKFYFIKKNQTLTLGSDIICE